MAAEDVETPIVTDKKPTLKIAFGCKSRVGKDTAAAYLQDKHGGQILSFAQPLKEIMAYAQRVCGFDAIKDTKFLQMVGTEWARDREPGVWVRLLTEKIDAGGHTYITDLRFQNEAAELKKLGFVCVKINRGERTIDRDPSHQSENDLANWDGWDYVINNDSTMVKFYELLDFIVTEIQTK